MNTKKPSVFVAFISILFFVSILLFFSCSGSKRVVSEKAFSFTEEEFPDIYKGIVQPPEYMSPKEKAMRLKLNEIAVYHLFIDTLQNKIQLDLSSKVCAKLGLPTSAEKLIRADFENGIECAKNQGDQYYSWYLRSMAKIIAAERLKKKEERGFYLTPIDGTPPE